MAPLFGPSGNSESFYEQGYKKTEQSMEWLKNMGLTAYEYSAGKGIFGSEETFRTIGRNALQHGIKLSLHAPYYISLSGADFEKRMNSLKYISDSARAADYMGADIIVVHSGSVGKMTREDALELSKDTLYKTLEKLEELGLSHIKIGIETMGKINQLGTLDEVLETCSMDSRLYPVVDFGHLYARSMGNDFLTADDYKAAFDKIADRLSPEKAIKLHCHFSRIEFTKGGEKKHLKLYEGLEDGFGPPSEPFIRTVADYGLSPTVICESDGTMAEDALAMMKLYEKYKDN